ncbi:MAG: DNA polymerase/3'-5' exonuclease PolX [Saprospiraceae bacterium]|nr:DNA polymerase/3'-5' exonuclease PolX [Saprospiraceae bacterium]
MTNKEIGELFGELASLMELHGDNEFKIRAYSSAYLTIKKLDIPLLEKSKEELSKLTVISKAVAEKIVELSSTGKIEALEELRHKTPEGIRAMFKIKGVGPKKVKVFWKEMNLESIGELHYACKENRLILYKGFGPKIQEDIIKNIEYLQSNEGSFLYAKLKLISDELLLELKSINPKLTIQETGELRRCMPILQKIEFLVDNSTVTFSEKFSIESETTTTIKGKFLDNFPFEFTICNPKEFHTQLLISTGGSDAFKKFIHIDKVKDIHSEEEYFNSAKLPYIPAECRDIDDYNDFDNNKLVIDSDILGVIHNHSTYSDGMYDIQTMAQECIRLGYKYLVISDHSKTAAYANGLPIERVEMQWREIDELNKKLHPFKIYKSIESDILSDGSLDYPEDILKGFDLVIASIHSNLNMDEEKAMMRLMNAIENPYTKVLGHLTGRLLLSRRGYPVNHKKIIDACSANNVSIEINANPVRLDMDYTWVPYAMKKEVMISINPDAHNLKGIQDIKYGVIAARKGGLTRDYCLNTLSQEDFNGWLKGSLSRK